MDHSMDEGSQCLGMFDCLSAKERVTEKRNSYAHKRASRRIGVERSMRVVHNQPHLIEPMKLTLYEPMPSTPVTVQPSQVSRIVHQSRKSISRLSARTNFATRRRTPSKTSISKPQAVLSMDDCQLRRNPSFRPLQLSIYRSNSKRLSDLPEFDSISFSEEGEIKPPPRALIRTQSEELLRDRSPTSENSPGKPASMFEQSLSRRMSHVRDKTTSTAISTSRPPSEYDALRSHPVSWYSLPGLPPSMQFATAPAEARKFLSPMKEEFTPPPNGAVMINGRFLAFPDIEADRIPTEMAHTSLLPPAHGQEGMPAAPSPIIDPGPTRRTTVITQHKAKISESASILLASSVASNRNHATTIEQSKPGAAEQPQPSSRADFKRQNRIDQWLGNDKKLDEQARSRGSSVSTIKTTSTSSSFAEHRRKRSHFYQLNHQKPNATSAVDEQKDTVKVLKTPTPLTLYSAFPPPKVINAISHAQTETRSKSVTSIMSHARTQTTSTIASSVATDILFELPETPELEHEDQFSSAQVLLHSNQRAYDAESMTTVDMKSRTGTMKSTVTAASSYRQRSPSPVPATFDNHGHSISEIIAVSKGSSDFNFRATTPSPYTASPCTPLSAKAQDVEKMMFAMCAQSGYRRVNVGVAF